MKYTRPGTGVTPRPSRLRWPRPARGGIGSPPPRHDAPRRSRATRRTSSSSTEAYEARISAMVRGWPRRNRSRASCRAREGPSSCCISPLARSITTIRRISSSVGPRSSYSSSTASIRSSVSETRSGVVPALIVTAPSVGPRRIGSRPRVGEPRRSRTSRKSRLEVPPPRIPTATRNGQGVGIAGDRPPRPRARCTCEVSRGSRRVPPSGSETGVGRSPPPVQIRWRRR